MIAPTNRSRASRRAVLLLPWLLGAAVLLPTAAARADDANTVKATPAEVSQLLFVAGDVQRLSRNPSGTVDTVLEKTLQQLYRDEPGLASDTAVQDIERLRTAVSSAGDDASEATLAAQPGNQRVITLLARLSGATGPARVTRALTEVADQALTESSRTARAPGAVFNPAADTASTLLFGSFSPQSTLRATVTLADANARFAAARDTLWAASAKQRLGDSPAQLMASNPALDNEAVHTLTRGLAADGSLTTTRSALMTLAGSGLKAVNDQTALAIADHNTIARGCPAASYCEAARETARNNSLAAGPRIAEQQAVLSASVSLLRVNDANLSAAIAAEAQASAQVANSVNAYFAASDLGETISAVSDVAGLLVSLSVAYVDPAAAITGAVQVARNIVGRATSGPDADALILTGLQGVSQQLSAFSRATEAQFRGIDARVQSLTRDVATLAGQLSAQLSEARMQLTDLNSALVNLQGSVDRLHSEIQRLFTTEAQNDLDSLANQYLGRGDLDRNELPKAAGALYTDATKVATTGTVLDATSGYDALMALMRGDLDRNVNFFSLFPARVTDSPAGLAWPRAQDDTSPFGLADTCPGGNPARGLCLPAPDFWAASSRAFAQLLLENRDAVTADRLDQLDAMIAGGTSLRRALDRIAARDTSNGTGSRLLNAALAYYASWAGRDAQRTSGPPALLQALRAERTRYLESVRVMNAPKVTVTGPWIDPYDSVRQSTDSVNLFGLPALSTATSDDGRSSITNLRYAPAIQNWLPVEVRNALRLGLAELGVTWTARWQSPADQVYKALGTLNARLNFTLTFKDSTPLTLGALQAIRPFTENCSKLGVDSASEAFKLNWGPAFCSRNFADEINIAALGTGANGPGTYTSDQSGFPAAVAAATTAVNVRLRELQDETLKDFLAPNGQLTSGTGPATNVYDAADRVGGAQTLLDGYIALGLPQALSTDDGLRALVAGEKANALLHPYGDGATADPAYPADTVRDQVVAFIRYVQTVRPFSDPLFALGTRFNEHRDALEAAIMPYVKMGRAIGQTEADGGRLDQSSPLITSTLDRLALTRAVLQAHLSRPPVPVATPTPAPTAMPAPTAVPAGTPSTPAQPAPAAPVAGTTPAATVARARVVSAPRARRGTIRLTVRCETGTCPIGATAKTGTRTIARQPAVTLRAGAQRVITLRLDRTGRRLLTQRRRLRIVVRITLANSTLSRSTLLVRR